MSQRRRRHDRTAKTAKTTAPTVSQDGAVQAAEGSSSSPEQPVPTLGRRRLIRFLLLSGIMAALFALRHLWWPPAFRALARADLHVGRVEECLDKLKYVDWLAPDDAATTLLRARAYRKLGEMQLVKELLAEARREGAPEEQIWREQILACAQSGQMREAQPYLDEFLNDPDEDLDDVCEAYVLGYIRNQRFQDALVLLNAWTVDSPELATPFLLRGRLLAYRNDFANAESDLRTALSLDPNQDEARVELALLLTKGNRMDEAIPLLEQSLESPKLRSNAAVLLATCLKATGENTRALQLLESTRKQFPEDQGLLLELGRIQFENGDYEAAAETLNKLVELNPLNDEAHYVLAQSLSLCGRQAEAEPHFEYVTQARVALSEIDRLNGEVRRNPTDVETLVRLGELYLQNASAEEGVIRLHSALDLDPENQQAHRLLYEHYSELAQTDEAYRSLAETHRRHLQ